MMPFSWEGDVWPTLFIPEMYIAAPDCVEAVSVTYSVGVIPYRCGSLIEAMPWYPTPLWADTMGALLPAARSACTSGRYMEATGSAKTMSGFGAPTCEIWVLSVSD